MFTNRVALQQYVEAFLKDTIQNWEAMLRAHNTEWIISEKALDYLSNRLDDLVVRLCEETRVCAQMRTGSVTDYDIISQDIYDAWDLMKS